MNTEQGTATQNSHNANIHRAIDDAESMAADYRREAEVTAAVAAQALIQTGLIPADLLTKVMQTQAVAAAHRAIADATYRVPHTANQEAGL
jgi:ribulose 1,5-bisphosphate carboxylase large subunit-like protein